jgi:hypothetical protein
MGGNVDTFLMQNEQKEWGSAKGTRAPSCETIASS